MVAERLIDINTKLAITLDQTERGDKTAFYFDIVNEAIKTIDYKLHVLAFDKGVIAVDIVINHL